MSRFSKTEDETLLGARAENCTEAKNCMFQDAKKLGFSAQEIKHLKRLYKEKLTRRVHKK